MGAAASSNKPPTEKSKDPFFINPRDITLKGNPAFFDYINMNNNIKNIVSESSSRIGTDTQLLEGGWKIETKAVLKSDIGAIKCLAVQGPYLFVGIATHVMLYTFESVEQGLIPEQTSFCLMEMASSISKIYATVEGNSYLVVAGDRCGFVGITKVRIPTPKDQRVSFETPTYIDPSKGACSIQNSGVFDERNIDKTRSVVSHILYWRNKAIVVATQDHADFWTLEGVKLTQLDPLYIQSMNVWRGMLIIVTRYATLCYSDIPSPTCKPIVHNHSQDAKTGFSQSISIVWPNFICEDVLVVGTSKLQLITFDTSSSLKTLATPTLNPKMNTKFQTKAQSASNQIMSSVLFKNKLIVGDDRGYVMCMDSLESCLEPWGKHAYEVFCLQVFNNTWIVSGSGDRHIKLWNRNGVERCNFKCENAVRFIENFGGYLAIDAPGGTVQIIELSTQWLTLLLIARYKEPECVFYKDHLPRDVFREIISWI